MKKVPDVPEILNILYNHIFYHHTINEILLLSCVMILNLMVQVVQNNEIIDY